MAQEGLCCTLGGVRGGEQSYHQLLTTHAEDISHSSLWIGRQIQCLWKRLGSRSCPNIELLWQSFLHEAMNQHLARDHQQLPGFTVSSLWHKNLKLWWKNFLLEPGSIYGSRCLVVHYFTNVSLSNMWHHLGDKFATDANLGGRICYQWDNFCYGLISEPVSSDLCSGIVVLLWYCFGTVLVLFWYCCGTVVVPLVWLWYLPQHCIGEGTACLCKVIGPISWGSRDPALYICIYICQHVSQCKMYICTCKGSPPE